jgi:acetaldehyde dehydrogenase
MNCFIIGAGKIGIDLYIKSKRIKIFEKIFIFNRNKFSHGGKHCIKNNFNYSDKGIKDLLKKIDKDKINIVFDASSANSSFKNFSLLKKFLKYVFYINLTPSKIGSYIVPYHSIDKIPKKINLITCGGQSAIHLIAGINKKIKNIKYVELVSSISSYSAGKATRENINEYIINTKNAIKILTGIKNNKVIINLNPSYPPVNMMNSIFFETSGSLSNIDFQIIKNEIKKINKKIKIYIPDYNAKLFKTFNSNVFRITIRVIGQGDHLPPYAGNLDIITSSAAYIAKLIYEKNSS